MSLLSRSSPDRAAPLQTLLEEVPPRRGVGFFFVFASVKTHAHLARTRLGGSLLLSVASCTFSFESKQP